MATVDLRAHSGLIPSLECRRFGCASDGLISFIRHIEFAKRWVPLLPHSSFSLTPIPLAPTLHCFPKWKLKTRWNIFSARLSRIRLDHSNWTDHIVKSDCLPMPKWMRANVLHTRDKSHCSWHYIVIKKIRTNFALYCACFNELKYKFLPR